MRCVGAEPSIRVKFVRVLSPELLGVMHDPRVDRYYSTRGDDSTTYIQAASGCYP